MNGYPNPLVFNVSDFRIGFPYFANATTYPDATLQRFWDSATGFIDTSNIGILRDQFRQQALNLMTAHLGRLTDLIAQNGGAMIGMVTEARIDKVQVTVAAPPNKSQFQWWLNLTEYGSELLALLSVQSAGGWAIGGSFAVPSFSGRPLRPRGCW